MAAAERAAKKARCVERERRMCEEGERALWYEAARASTTWRRVHDPSDDEGFCEKQIQVGPWTVYLDAFFPVSSRLDRGPWITPWIPTAVMPPTQVDPFWMPGVLPMPTRRLSIEDMSSDNDAEPEIRYPIGSKKSGKLNVAPPAARGKLARGGESSRAPQAPDAPGHGGAAPAAVETSGEPAKCSSPLRKPQRLRADPAPSKRRRSLSGNVSEAPAASLPSGAMAASGAKASADALAAAAAEVEPSAAAAAAVRSGAASSN